MDNTQPKATPTDTPQPAQPALTTEEVAFWVAELKDLDGLLAKMKKNSDFFVVIIVNPVAQEHTPAQVTIDGIRDYGQPH